MKHSNLLEKLFFFTRFTQMWDTGVVLDLHLVSN